MMFFQNVVFGVRTLLKNPGFTIVAVLALGLGVGVTSAMFTIIHTVLLQPLPFPHSERLVNVWEANLKRNIPSFTVTPANYYDWRKQNKVLSALGAYQQTTFNLASREGEPERYLGAICDQGFFAVLNVAPKLGRVFREDEEQAGRDSVVVLSYALWRDRFGGDKNILGQNVIFDDRPRTVIGVMPETFEYPPQSSMWMPLGFDDQMRARRDLHRLRVIGRLADNIPLDQARTEFQTISARLAMEYPNSNKDSSTSVHPLLEDLVGWLRPALLILLGAVLFVFLIMCANVANLLLVKAVGRQREVAIRSSLGASRAQLVWQMLTESAILSLAGGVVALVLAYALFHGLLSFAPSDLPRFNHVNLDWRAIGLTLVISLLTSVLFGLAPAWYGSKTDVNLVLKETIGGVTSVSRSRSFLQQILVVVQVAAALVLLVSAGLLIHSFYKIEQVDPGFDPHNVITMRLAPARFKYRGHDDLLVTLSHDILRRVSALPGVKSAAIVTDVPLLGNPVVVMQFEGRPVQPSEAPLANYFAATPQYAEVMGLRLLRGRFIGEQDTPGSPLVVVVNQTLVDRYFRGENPLGKRIVTGLRPQPLLREIIGVVADVKNDGLDQDTPVQVYIPYVQQPSLFNLPSPITVLARTSQNPETLGESVKAAILDVDRSQPVYDVQTMEAIVSKSLSEQRFSLILMIFFAGTALFLAAMGIYGVMSYMVAQRTGEIGIRMALGAKHLQIWLLVLRQGMHLAIAGLVIGITGALFLTRLMHSLLFGITAVDPFTFISVAVILLLVSLFACYLPARRATRVDPWIALRYE